MATVSKEIADKIIAGGYPDDTPAVKIVKYTNMEGADAYGVIYAHESLDKYRESVFVRGPVTYWEKT
jgi:hypothetical protein